MKPEYILDADLLDIIFENKNKNYGAYALRRHYNERLYKALGIIFFTTMIIGLFGILYKNKIIVAPTIPDVVFAGPPVELPMDKPKPPEPPRVPKQLVAPAAPSTDIKPEVDEHSSSNLVIAKDGDKINDPAPDGGNTIAGNNQAGSGSPAGGETGLPATTSAAGEPATTIDKNIPRPADIMPTFPGGLEALKKFLKKNLVTPREFDREETVSVKVQFVVGYDGELKGFKVIEDGGAVFNDEVIRVLKKMPAWIPGKAHGENVSVYYTIPVMFTTEE